MLGFQRQLDGTQLFFQFAHRPSDTAPFGTEVSDFRVLRGKFLLQLVDASIGLSKLAVEITVGKLLSLYCFKRMLELVG
jgi:hypothetical protein